MRCIRISVLMLVLVGPASAQTAVSFADYRAAVTAYREGDIDLAAELLANRSPESLRRALDDLLIYNDDWRVAGGAAMLHTELVLQSRAVTKSDISLHMSVALKIVENARLSRTPPDRALAQTIAEFRERWYSLAATVFLSATDPENASQFVSRGLSVFKKSARLHMLAGVVDEMRAHLRYADLHDRSIISAMRPSPARQDLLTAIGEYRTALETEPSLAEARLRLGRTLALTNRVEPAREALQTAASTPDNTRVAYLAQLFLGALSSFERDYTSARQAFQAALAIAPMCQTPYIALAFVERMTGHDEAAHALFERFADWQSAPLESDPWWAYQNGGLDDDSLVWLRAKVAE